MTYGRWCLEEKKKQRQNKTRRCKIYDSSSRSFWRRPPLCSESANNRPDRMKYLSVLLCARCGTFFSFFAFALSTVPSSRFEYSLMDNHVQNASALQDPLCIPRITPFAFIQSVRDISRALFLPRTLDKNLFRSRSLLHAVSIKLSPLLHACYRLKRLTLWSFIVFIQSNQQISLTKKESFRNVLI